VARVGIRAIVFVDLFFGRDALLVDKNGYAHGERRGHPFAIVDTEEFGEHGASDSACGVEVRVVRRIHLCTGLLERDGRVLLVANAYPNQPALLWNLPGGRQEAGESCAMAAVRELREETSLRVRVRGLAYVAESFDPASDTQFTAFCFAVDAAGEPRVPDGDRHVRECRWVPRADLASLLAVRVVREPLLRHLADPQERYFAYPDAGITIAFGDDPA
jgi:ADP-ribose pyrophosphatase YjhB (NUDIX family)